MYIYGCACFQWFHEVKVIVLLYHSYSLPLKELIVTDQQLHEDRFDKFEDPFGRICTSRDTHAHTRTYTYKENMS